MMSKHEPAVCDCPECTAIRTAWAREQLVNLAVNEVFGESRISVHFPEALED